MVTFWNKKDRKEQKIDCILLSVFIYSYVVCKAAYYPRKALNICKN